MTLNGVIALILRYLIEFNSFAGRLRTEWLKVDLQFAQDIVFQLYLAKTDPCSSRTVSLRQLSFLYMLQLLVDYSLTICLSNNYGSSQLSPVSLQ